MTHPTKFDGTLAATLRHICLPQLPSRILRRIASRRPPDHVIGGTSDPYLLRWWLIPRNRWCGLYLHLFVRSDDARALHDHPWWNASLLLSGSYREHMPGGRVVERRAGQVIARRATAAHRVELHDCPVWTLFAVGPKMREWGFRCPQGWRHWREFTSAEDGGATVGKGCE